MPKENPSLGGNERGSDFGKTRNLEMWYGSLQGVRFAFDYEKKTITTPEGDVFDHNSPMLPLLVRSLYQRGADKPLDLTQYTDGKTND